MTRLAGRRERATDGLHQQIHEQIFLLVVQSTVGENLLDRSLQLLTQICQNNMRIAFDPISQKLNLGKIQCSIRENAPAQTHKLVKGAVSHPVPVHTR